MAELWVNYLIAESEGQMFDKQPAKKSNTDVHNESENSSNRDKAINNDKKVNNNSNNISQMNNVPTIPINTFKSNLTINSSLINSSSTKFEEISLHSPAFKDIKS